MNRFFFSNYILFDNKKIFLCFGFIFSKLHEKICFCKVNILIIKIINEKNKKKSIALLESNTNCNYTIILF